MDIFSFWTSRSSADSAGEGKGLDCYNQAALQTGTQAKERVLFAVQTAIEDIRAKVSSRHECQHRIFNLLDVYWSKCSEDRLPSRTDIDPLELGPCLGHLALVDIEKAPFRPRYRLVGTELVRMYGEELKGRYVDELFSEKVREETLAAYRAVVETATPLFMERKLFGLIEQFGYLRVMLPLSSDGVTIDGVLVDIFSKQTGVFDAGSWRTPENLGTSSNLTAPETFF